jgi:ribonuclease P protein component
MRRFASLRRRGEFARLRRHGRRTPAVHFTLYTAQAAMQERSLVGISVSKSVGIAVVRNTVKRRVSAALHDLLPCEAHVRILVIARPSSAQAPYAEMREDLRRALA